MNEWMNEFRCSVVCNIQSKQLINFSARLSRVRARFGWSDTIYRIRTDCGFYDVNKTTWQIKLEKLESLGPSSRRTYSSSSWNLHFNIHTYFHCFHSYILKYCIDSSLLFCIFESTPIVISFDNVCHHAFVFSQKNRLPKRAFGYFSSLQYKFSSICCWH